MSNHIKIKKISNRLSFAESVSENDNKVVSIIVLPYIDKWKFWGLLVWIVAWTVSGLLILASYKISDNSNQKLFIIIFAFFWLYYEWKMIHVFLWRKMGKEKLWIRDGKLYIEENTGIRKKLNVFSLSDINSIELSEFNEKSFTDFISNSFWNKGKPRIRVNVLGKNYYCAYQITDAEASAIIRELRASVQKIK